MLKKIITSASLLIAVCLMLSACTGNTPVTDPVIEPDTPTTVTITFNDNSGENITSEQEFTELAALNKNSFIREDMTFTGWNTASDGTGTPYYDTQRIFPESDITLYAQWRETPYTATLYSYINDGTYEQPFDYDDSYFSAASTEENLDLARFCVVASAAAYAAPSIADVLVKTGYMPVLQDYTDATEKNIEISAYTLAVKISDDGTAIWGLVVRGTANVYEWQSNFEIGSETEHKGFSDTASRIYEKALAAIKKAGYAKNKLWITGHSRGAAVSDMLAKFFNGSSYFQQGDVFAYSFATPSVTTDAQGCENVFNYVIGGDIVAYLPLSEWGYTKFGTTTMLATKGNDYTRFKTLFGLATGNAYSGDTAENAELTSAYLAELAPTVKSFYEPNEYGVVLYDVILKAMPALINGQAVSDIGLTDEFLDNTTVKKLAILLSRYGSGAAGYAHSPEAYIVWINGLN